MSLITSYLTEDVLYICPHGRIDTTNAAEAERQINEIKDAKEVSNLMLDLDDLSYISSAGLRVILRLRKEYPEFEIINTGSEVYEILDMTGFTEMMPVSKAYKQISVDGCDIIGKGAKGTVYRYTPDTVVKVYHDPNALPAIHKERELARRAFVMGIPTAISYDVVRVGESYGSVFELLDASSYTKLIGQDPENMDVYVREVADLLRQIHGTKVKSTDMPPVKDTVQKWLDIVVPELSPEAGQKLVALKDAASDDTYMIHGDFHTNNIMKQNGETLLIDMDTLSYGDSVFELANIYISYVGFSMISPKMTEEFIGLPIETCYAVWESFINAYFEGEDPDVIAQKKKEIRLWSTVRVMRHVLRRGGKDTEDGRRILAACKEELEETLK